MITVEIRNELAAEDRAELEVLIADAAAYDEEAGFSTASLDDEADGNVEVFRAVARLNPGMHGSPESPVVAYLRLEVDRAGGAGAQLLVRRGYRSLGIATLMLEMLSEREGPGWAGTGAVSISGWARGNHPAADRMARRLGAEVERNLLKLVRGEGPGAEVRYVDASDESAVLATRRDGFVHEHTDVCYVWRAPVRPRPRPRPGSPRR